MFQAWRLREFTKTLPDARVVRGIWFGRMKNEPRSIDRPTPCRSNATWVDLY
jgi:hypothetical protein